MTVPVVFTYFMLLPWPSDALGCQIAVAPLAGQNGDGSLGGSLNGHEPSYDSPLRLTSKSS